MRVSAPDFGIWQYPCRYRRLLGGLQPGLLIVLVSATPADRPLAAPAAVAQRPPADRQRSAEASCPRAHGLALAPHLSSPTS